MNDLTSGLRELANVDAHSAVPVTSPLVPGGVPHTFYPPLSVSGIELRVIRDGSPARRLRINTARCTFGSAEGCTVRLSDSSLLPLHAVIVRQADRVLIRSESTAIEVNGQPTSESLLDCGDVFRLGSYLFETLSLPQAPADSAQDQAQRLRFMTAPDPELDAARLREQETQQRLAEALQRSENVQTQLDAAHRTVAELHQQIGSLNLQLETLVAETQTQQADAEAQASELRRLIDTSAQAELRNRAAVSEAQQQRDQAQQQASEIKLQHEQAQQQLAELLQQRDTAMQARDQVSQQLDEALKDRDQALQQQAEALQQRNEAVQQRDQAMARRSDAIDSEQAAQAKLRQLNQQIQQLQQAQAAAESEKLNELSLEAYMSRLLQQMERSPATPAPRSAVRQHLPSEPQPTATAAVFAADVADEPATSAVGAVAESLEPAPQPLLSTEPQPRRAGSSPLMPPPVPPRPSAWSNVLQVALVFTCSLIFLYCGQRNPDLQVVWYTASALAGGLVLFAVYDLLTKSLRRTSLIRRRSAAAISSSGPRYCEQ